MEHWLSLFDGMSCLQIAAKELGISPQKYYASEIDKHAIVQTQLNFPDTIQLGSVTEWRTWDIDWSKVSLIGAGSPCQGFSFAGKQLAFDDPRSVLFFVFIDILNHCRKFNPNVKFLLENVDMKREHMNVINNYCGLFAVNINSNRVSAQNRNRWYWSNIRTKQVGLFGETHTDIPQPKDKGILLKDILESEVDEKYYLSDKMIDWLDRHGEKMGVEMKKLDGNQKTACLTATAQVKQNLTTDYVCVAMRGRNPENPSDRRIGSQTVQRLEPNLSRKTNCLTSIQKDNLVMTQNYVQWDGVGFDQDNRAYFENGKSGTLDLKPNRQKTLLNDSRIRRLTPLECSRLQTIPEWYKWESPNGYRCSDTQQYRMLGNGWTVEVISWILSFKIN